MVSCQREKAAKSVKPNLRRQIGSRMCGSGGWFGIDGYGGERRGLKGNGGSLGYCHVIVKDPNWELYIEGIATKISTLEI